MRQAKRILWKMGVYKAFALEDWVLNLYCMVCFLLKKAFAECRSNILCFSIVYKLVDKSLNTPLLLNER